MDLYYIIAGLTWLLSLVVSKKMQHTYAQWNQVRTVTGATGHQVARTILDANGLNRLPVEPTGGKLTDHYDPRDKHISLSEGNYYGNSVSATAVSAHECGHALQDADNYGPMELKSKLVPLAQVAARFGLPAAVGGSFLGFPLLVQIGLLAYAGSIGVYFLTLPVEFNASKRALQQLESLRLVSPDGRDGAKKVLRAAALTYVAGAATSAGYVLYLALIYGGALFGKKPPPLPPSV